MPHAPAAMIDYIAGICELKQTFFPLTSLLGKYLVTVIGKITTARTLPPVNGWNGGWGWLCSHSVIYSSGASLEMAAFHPCAIQEMAALVGRKRAAFEGGRAETPPSV